MEFLVLIEILPGFISVEKNSYNQFLYKSLASYKKLTGFITMTTSLFSVTLFQ